MVIQCYLTQKGDFVSMVLLYVDTFNSMNSPIKERYKREKAAENL